MYHLPKRKYAEVDSMSHITNIVDNKLDEHPQNVVVCGGDLNKLNIDRLEELTGWNRRCWVFRQEASHAYINVSQIARTFLGNATLTKC